MIHIFSPLLLAKSRKTAIRAAQPASSTCRGLRQHPLKCIEASGPARAVAVARRFVEEALVRQRQDTAGAVGLDVDGDERLALRRALPGPSEHQLPVRHDLAIHAADA